MSKETIGLWEYSSPKPVEMKADDASLCASLCEVGSESYNTALDVSNRSDMVGVYKNLMLNCCRLNDVMQRIEGLYHIDRYAIFKEILKSRYIQSENLEDYLVEPGLKA